MNTKPSRADQEDRRRTAVQKVADGWSCTDVADFLGLHVETVRRRVRVHKAAGDAGLARAPHPGRKPFLTPDQQAEVLGWLAREPTEFGFRTDLWTAARVAQLIREKFGAPITPTTSASGSPTGGRRLRNPPGGRNSGSRPSSSGGSRTTIPRSRKS